MHANHKTITAARHKLGITLNWLLEPVCFLCEENGEWRHGLCKHCWQRLPHNLSCCRICALPLDSRGLCGICQVTSMAYERIIAPTVYRHPIDQMLCSLKYAGAFTLSRSLTGKQVAIVDDVVTSCSTVAELAKVLKSGGAVVVDVWACARTPV